MASPNFAILFQAELDGAATAGSAADVLIPDATSGLYVKSTAAARGSRRSTGIALASYVAGGVVEILQFGEVSAVQAGLGSGSASWVRVSSTGQLERATVAGADDVVGYVQADGTFHACFGFLTAAIVNGSGGGGGTPGGADTQFQYNAAGSFAGTSGATYDAANNRPVFTNGWAVPNGANTAVFAVTPSAARVITFPDGTYTVVGAASTQTLTNKTLNGSNNTFTNIPLTTAVTGTLPVANGGTGVTALTGFTTLIDSTSRIGSRSFFCDETSDATAGPATVNDYAIGDYGQLLVAASAGTISYTGFAAPAAGESRDLVIIGAQAGNGFKLLHDNAGSTAANRIYINSGLSGVTAYSARLRYSPGQSRWVLVGYLV